MAYLLAASVPLAVGVYYKLRNHYSFQSSNERDIESPFPSLTTSTVVSSTVVQTSLPKMIIFNPDESFNSKNNLEFLKQNSRYKSLLEFTKQGGIKTLNAVSSIIKYENLSLKKFP